MKRFGILVLIALTALLCGCSTLDAVTGQSTRNFYSLQDDVRFGEQLQQETRETLRARGVMVDQDPVRCAQLNTMLRRITAVSHLPDLPYEVMLIQSPVVNAMAAPGGKVMVYEGLWDPEDGLVRDDDELAAVMAHEIAHVTCRHSTEAMTRRLPLNTAAMLLLVFSKGTEYEERARILAAGGMIFVNGVWMTRYSRADELEADRTGLIYMARAGYDPRAALRIWERSANRRGPKLPVTHLFSSHPPDAERFQQLRDVLPEALQVYEAAQRRRSS